MPDLKSYTCAKCGAVLSVDKMEGLMACPFCGNEFDVVDFHSEDLLLQAEECLARGAYTPAGEKFHQVLESDPGSIRAYRGLILCTAKIQSTEVLKDRYDQSSSDLLAIKEIALSAKEHVTQRDSAYLEKMVSLFEIPATYNDTDKRKKENWILERKRNQQIDHQAEVQDKKHFWVTPVFAILIALLLGAIVMISGTTAIHGLKEGLKSLRYFVPFVILLIVGCWLIKKPTIKKPVKITESTDSLAEKLDNIEAEYAQILSEVLEYEKTFMKKPEDKAIRKKAIKNEPETGNITNVICAKCGGYLKLNNDQELYECSSCGVSYGKYLFFGDLTANAVKAMNMGEFDEADQILSHKLTLNPKDFDALFGRFLCAGGWKSLKDMDIDDRMFMAHVRQLKGKLDAIEKRISLEDQPLWKDIRALSDLLAEYSVRRHAFNRTNEKYQSICGKLTNTFLMDDERKDYENQEGEIREQVTALEGECDEIRVRIEEAIKVLANAESNCIFF